MTSSRLRKWIVFVVLLAALAAIWTVIWRAGAARLTGELAAAIHRAQARGVRAACDNPKVAGFPFAMTLVCDSGAYARDLDGVSLTSGAVAAGWTPLAPFTVSARLAAPAHAELPGFVPLDLTWSSLTGTFGLWLPRPSGATFDAAGLTAASESGGAVFSAATAKGRAKVAGDDIALTADVVGLVVDPAFASGYALPPLSLVLRGALVDGAPGVLRRRPSLRGATIVLDSLSLGGERVGLLTLTGRIAVDSDGVSDGEMTVRLDDPDAIAALIQSGPGDYAAQARAGLDAFLAMQGSPGAGVTLRIEKGRAFLGLLPLGFVPPLR